MHRWTRADTLKWVLAAAVAATAFLIDLLAKQVVRGHLVVGERHDLLPFFYLQRTVNGGVAFGMLAGRYGFIVVANLVALALVIVYLVVETRPVIAGIGAGLLIGGSLGNLGERLARGEVTDFFKIPYWPNFNLADLFILSGAVTIAVSLLLDWKRQDTVEAKV